MMKKLHLFIVVILLATTQILAQGSLTFHTETYNFGRLPKKETPITYNFVFQNTSNKAVTLKQVEADCACSTVSFPKSFIAPNEESMITVTFSPYRAGPFEKEFVILTEGNHEKYLLKIKGYILPYSNENTINDFVHQNGSFRFRQKNLNLGTLTTHIPVTKKLYFHNSTNKNITFTNQITSPKHIKVFFDSSMTVKAGAIGAIVVKYNPQEKNAFGFLKDEIVLQTTAKEKIAITVAADVQPDTYIPDSSGKMPSICVSEALHHVEGVSPDKDLITEFIVRNEGNVELKIHKIAGSEGCEVLSGIENIAPNASSTIRVRFLHNGKHGHHDRAFTIYSNDPYKSKQVIALRANVTE
jgi:hypothetical protein